MEPSLWVDTDLQADPNLEYEQCFMHQLLFFQLPFDKSQQSKGFPCTRPVELGTLIFALCTLRSGGFDTSIYLTWSNYLANTEKCNSYPKSVKPRRERRGGSPHLSSAPLCLTNCQCSPAIWWRKTATSNSSQLRHLFQDGINHS